jgi:uncharacterized protein
MQYEWDPDKAEASAAKYGVRFADAVAVFADDMALTMADPHPNEERYVTIGMDALARVVVVAYTWRAADTIRLISARRATRHEQRQYERGES